MIGRIRRKFVILCGISVFLVFSGIFILLVIFSTIQLNRTMDSLTDNQGLAAGIGVALILFNYYSVSLSEYVSATSFGSIVTLSVLSVLIGLIIRYLTKNEILGYGISILLLGCVCAAGIAAPEKFEGLLPDIMRTLSLFERFNTFVSGVFDLTAVVYYVSVIIFFLFLSVQSLEKRRYN